ncbi:unnamed protein product, partial [Pylaiella littoralis]
MDTSCRLVVGLWLLVHPLSTSSAAAQAEFRTGDVVPMSHRSQPSTGRAQGETPWEEALRSQMPRFGKPGTVHFKPALSEGSSALSPDEEDDGLAVTFAFSHERFVLRRVSLREAEGSDGDTKRRPLLNRVVVTFAFAAGDIVGVRSDPIYDGDGGSGVTAAGSQGFEIEYRWDRLPEEDEQAGLWLVFAASLVLTVVLAMDACNSIDGGDVDGDEGRQVGGLMSSSLPPSGRSGG